MVLPAGSPSGANWRADYLFPWIRMRISVAGNPNSAACALRTSESLRLCRRVLALPLPVVSQRAAFCKRRFSPSATPFCRPVKFPSVIRVARGHVGHQSRTVATNLAALTYTSPSDSTVASAGVCQSCSLFLRVRTPPYVSNASRVQNLAPTSVFVCVCCNPWSLGSTSFYDQPPHYEKSLLPH